MPADKVNGDDAQTVIKKEIEANRLAYELKLKKEADKIAAKKRKEADEKMKKEELKKGLGEKKKERIEELA